MTGLALGADVLTLGVADAAEAVRRGELRAVDLCEASLRAAESDRARPDTLGAFLTLQREEALRAAEAVDRKRSRGEPLGPLAGVPIGIKDALCTAGVPTTAGSRILVRGGGQPDAGYRPPRDATVVARLRAADAVLVGKCNMDEFAMGSSTENSAFFPARNPWDRTRTPGGSSGGSAAAVAGGLALAALGSDTGGSIRQPAAFTGTVGVKPTWGRVSRSGLVAFASSLDQVGPFARDVRGAARVLEVVAGHDPLDATSVDAPVPRCEDACAGEVRGLRIGVPAELFDGFAMDEGLAREGGLAPEVEAPVREALAALADLGATLVPLSLPHARFALSAYYVIATAEASSNLARFDGVRYGLRAPDADRLGSKDLAAFYASTRGAGFGAEVKRRILLGTYVLSAGYYEAYYLRAQKVRTLVRRDFDAAFEKVDVLAGPVSPTLPFLLGERTDDPLSMYLADVFTLPASLAGVPALSVPTRLAALGGTPLPVGLQLVAPPLEEARLFTVAAAWERARGPISPPPGSVSPPRGPDSSPPS